MVTDATKRHRDAFAFGLLGVAALYLISGLSLLFKSSDNLGAAVGFPEKAALFGYVFTHPLVVVSLFGAVAVVSGFGEMSRNAKTVVSGALAIGGVAFVFGALCWLAGLGANTGNGGSIGDLFNGIFGAGKVVSVLLGLAQLLLLALVEFYAVTVYQAFPKTVRSQGQWGQQPGWGQQQGGWGQPPQQGGQQGGWGYDPGQQAGWGQPWDQPGPAQHQQHQQHQQGQQTGWGQPGGYAGQQYGPPSQPTWGQPDSGGWGQPSQPAQPGQYAWGQHAEGDAVQASQWRQPRQGEYPDEHGQQTPSWGRAEHGAGTPDWGWQEGEEQQSRWGDSSTGAAESDEAAPAPTAEETQIWTGQDETDSSIRDDAGSGDHRDDEDQGPDEAAEPEDRDERDGDDRPSQQSWWQQPNQ